MRRVLFIFSLIPLFGGLGYHNGNVTITKQNFAYNSTTLEIISTNSKTSAKTIWSYSTDESGVNISVEFIDEDELVLDNTYDIGYDDNIELLITKTSDSVVWEKGKVYHFLLSGNGEIYFERTINANTIGDRFSKELGVVLGENLDYSLEYIYDDENKIGFKTNIFMSYDLLGLDNGENDISFCPAMRNTNIYQVDSVWSFYNQNGCNWSNPSTFIEIK